MLTKYYNYQEHTPGKLCVDHDYFNYKNWPFKYFGFQDILYTALVYLSTIYLVL